TRAFRTSAWPMTCTPHEGPRPRALPARHGRSPLPTRITDGVAQAKELAKKKPSLPSILDATEGERRLGRTLRALRRQGTRRHKPEVPAQDHHRRFAGASCLPATDPAYPAHKTSRIVVIHPDYY